MFLLDFLPEKWQKMPLKPGFCKNLPWGFKNLAESTGNFHRKSHMISIFGGGNTPPSPPPLIGEPEPAHQSRNAASSLKAVTFLFQITHLPKILLRRYGICRNSPFKNLLIGIYLAFLTETTDGICDSLRSYSIPRYFSSEDAASLFPRISQYKYSFSLA